MCHNNVAAKHTLRSDAFVAFYKSKSIPLLQQYNVFNIAIELN